MTFLPHAHTALARPAPPLKRRRRTATSVLAGDFDPRPQRDILTSLLNGVKPYRPPMTQGELREKEARREKRREREQMEEARRLERRNEIVTQRENTKIKTNHREKTSSSSKYQSHNAHGRKDFWSGRPSIGSDVTPDDLSDHSSYISHPSSKRPYTPPDDEMESHAIDGPSHQRLDPNAHSARRPGRPAKKRRSHISHERYGLDGQPNPEMESGESHVRKEPRKRVAHRKGWKGWVAFDELDPEATPDPTKLIELDRAVVLEDRRTRSGKNFDAIGEGKDTWVN